MSKKIDSALRRLIKALEKHADALGGARVSLKKAERANAKLQAAATEYAEVIYQKSGVDTPFTEVSRASLDTETLDSLSAERDALSRNLIGPIRLKDAAL
jgi:hypothetical protein